MNLSQFFKKAKKPMGLALGGGAALGAAHVGVLKAFAEKDIMPDMISGTSIGAFVAAHIAFGTPVEEIEKIALDLDWLDVTAIKISKMGLLTNKRLGKQIIEQIGMVTIEEAKIPLCVIATDITNGEKVVLNEGPLHKAVMASSCLPGIFAPVEWDKRLLVDGFLCENVPVSPLREMGAKHIIAVDLTTNRDFKRPDDIIDVLNNTFDIALNNMIKTQVTDKNIKWIQPKLSAYNKADTRQTKKLIREGYDAAVKVLEENS